MINQDCYTHDILIVGAGLVGLTCAALLARESFRVAVVESHPTQTLWEAERFDVRVSAISRASENIFKHIGVWSHLEKMRVSPYRNMYVWDENSDGVIEFAAAEIAEPNLGHVVENNALHQVLWERLRENIHVEFFCPETITDLTIDEGKAKVTCSNNQELIVKLLIGADGAKSWLRERLAMPLESRDYNHHALVTTIKTDLSHKNTAWQRFLTQGILALLPLTQPNTCSIVWSTQPEIAKNLYECDPAEFNRSITKAFAGKLGEVSVCDKRVLFPLRMQHAKEYVRPRVALIGDAAHTIHPLAGQGVNLGFMDAATLAQVLLQNRHKDIGAFSLLRRYERWRKTENLSMIYAMEAFKQLFGQQAFYLKTLRGLGLNMVNRAPILKDFFIKHAMGLRGDLPDNAVNIIN